MNNTRFATIIHILTLLADQPGEWLSSDYIAGSININPVVVRRELSVLRNTGWVESRQGKEGGFRLQVSGDDLYLKDVYLLIKKVEVLGKKNSNPNPKCPIGQQINEKLEALFEETDRAVLLSLKDISLAHFLQQFH